LDRSRGGLTTKNHALVDKKGRPNKLKQTAGPDMDINRATEIITDLPEGSLLLADRGYDYNVLRKMMADRKAGANRGVSVCLNSRLAFLK
jgi:IS5 family transposase